MSGQHAFLAPSFADAWGRCSGAPSAAAAVPQHDTPQSMEGTAAHWVFSECMTVWRQNDSTARASSWLGQTAPNGVVVDEKMVGGVQVAIDDVLQVCQEHGALRKVLIEHRVYMPRIHPEHNWGTLDLAIPLLDVGKLYLWDYKHGHRPVSAYSLQFVDYIEGLAQELNIDGHAAQYIEVIIRVVHPFTYHQSGGPISERRCTLADLRADINLLQCQAAEATTNPSMTAGGHCRDCPAVGRCSVARDAGYSAMAYLREAYAVDTMTAADLAVERMALLELKDLLKGRLDAVEDDLEQRIRHGEPGSGLTIEAALGRETWSVPVAQALSLCSQFGVDASKPALVTPKQAIDKAPKELRPALKQAVSMITQRPTTGTKLVPVEGGVTVRAFKTQED